MTTLARRRGWHVNGASQWGDLAPVYRAWQAMKNRCFNQKGQDYKYYGGRGISVYAPWVEHFEVFALDMGPRPEGYTLEREDVNADYSPWNCVWATRQTQARNRTYCTLDTVTARAIRRRYVRGKVRQQDLATKFGVSQTIISKVVLRKAWA